MSTSSKVPCTCNSVETAGFNFCEVHGVAQPRPAADHGISPARCQSCGYSIDGDGSASSHGELCFFRGRPQPPRPSERAQQMLVHATVAARGEANHHEIRQLREKVEALEKRVETLELSTTPQRAVDTERRLDAALKRIEELERA